MPSKRGEVRQGAKALQDARQERIVAEVQRELRGLSNKVRDVAERVRQKEQEERQEQQSGREQTRRRNERTGLTGRDQQQAGFAGRVQDRVAGAVGKFAAPLQAVKKALQVAAVIDYIVSQMLRNEDFIEGLVLKVVEEVVKTVTLQRTVQVAVEQGNERLRNEILSAAFLNNLAARLAEEPAFQREAAKVASAEFGRTEAARRIAARSAREAL